MCQQTCSYNSRRLGGFLATDHKSDLLRSVLRVALKKPSSTSSGVHGNSYLLEPTALLAPVLGPAAATERLNNVKPLLARKLQATVPLSSATKDCITVATGYNGHIQVSANNLGIVGSVTNPQLKRGIHHIETINNTVIKNNTLTVPKNKNKKAKINENGAGLNLLSNVVQVDASGSGKNHSIPVVAVSIPNGLSASQTFNLSNVNLSNMRNNGQPIRIHPSSMKTLVRDTSVVEAGRTLNTSSSASNAVTGATDGGSIVLGSSGPTSYLFADSLKSLKTDSSGSIRLELHPNTFTADNSSRFLHATQLSKGQYHLPICRSLPHKYINVFIDVSTTREVPKY